MSSDIGLCDACGDLHTRGDALELIQQHSHRINQLIDARVGLRDVSGIVEDFRLIARCLHAQLYAANADLANARTDIERLRESLNLGELLAVRTEYGIRRRNGEVWSPEGLTPPGARNHLRDMDRTARELGFDSAEAEVVSRDRGDYATDWTPVTEDTTPGPDEPPF